MVVVDGPNSYPKDKQPKRSKQCLRVDTTCLSIMMCEWLGPPQVVDVSPNKQNIGKWEGPRLCGPSRTEAEHHGRQVDRGIRSEEC